jgi:hypothetical protein
MYLRMLATVPERSNDPGRNNDPGRKTQEHISNMIAPMTSKLNYAGTVGIASASACMRTARLEIEIQDWK